VAFEEISARFISRDLVLYISGFHIGGERPLVLALIS